MTIVPETVAPWPQYHSAEFGLPGPPRIILVQAIEIFLLPIVSIT